MITISIRTALKSSSEIKVKSRKTDESAWSSMGFDINDTGGKLSRIFKILSEKKMLNSFASSSIKIRSGVISHDI